MAYRDRSFDTDQSTPISVSARIPLCMQTGQSRQHNKLAITNAVQISGQLLFLQVDCLTKIEQVYSKSVERNQNNTTTTGRTSEHDANVVTSMQFGCQVCTLVCLKTRLALVVLGLP